MGKIFGIGKGISPVFVGPPKDGGMEGKVPGRDFVVFLWVFFVCLGIIPYVFHKEGNSPFFPLSSSQFYFFLPVTHCVSITTLTKGDEAMVGIHHLSVLYPDSVVRRDFFF